MARTYSVLVNTSVAPTGSSPTSATSASITIPAFSAIVASVQWLCSSDVTGVAGTFSNQTSALTWTKKGASKNAGPFFGYYSSHELFVAVNNSASSITTTLRASKNVALPGDPHVVFKVVAVTSNASEIDFTDPWGVVAEYLQTDFTYPSPNSEWAAASASFSAAPATTSACIAFLATADQDSANSTSTPGSGWTELSDFIATSGYGALAVEYREGSTTATAAWTDVNDLTTNHLWVASILAIELKAPTGGGTTNLSSSSAISTSTSPASTFTPGTLNLPATGSSTSASTSPASTFTPQTLHLTTTSSVSTSTEGVSTLTPTGTVNMTGASSVSTSTEPASTLTPGTINLPTTVIVTQSVSPVSTLTPQTLTLVPTSSSSQSTSPASTLSPQTLAIPSASAVSQSVEGAGTLTPQTLVLTTTSSVSHAVVTDATFSGNLVLSGASAVSTSNVGAGTLIPIVLNLPAQGSSVSHSTSGASSLTPAPITFTPPSTVSQSISPASAFILGTRILAGVAAPSMSIVEDGVLLVQGSVVMDAESAVSVSITPMGTLTYPAPVMKKDPFARIRVRAANVIARFGGPIKFFEPGIPARPRGDGSWTNAVDPRVFEGTAIETRGEPEGVKIEDLTAGLVLKDPVVVLVAAEGLDGTPRVDLQMEWSDVRRVIRNVQPVAPNGSAIYYVVVGDI